MSGKLFFTVFLLITIWTTVFAQHTSPYSLQAAVDALRRRETQLALRDLEPRQSRERNYYMDDDDVPPMYRGQKIDKLLANYLAHEEEEEGGRYDNGPDDDGDDIYGPEDRKRSVFRERDELPYQSVFRERELENAPSYGSRQELAEEFLREIENERNIEREEKYRDTLRRLWEKYQQQETDLGRDLFDEEAAEEEEAGSIGDEDEEDEEERRRKKKRSDFEINDKRKRYGNGFSPDFYEKRKRQGGETMTPLYWGPIIEKRTLPVLPWLPATRKKRFPVTKRSPKPLDEPNVSGTNEKVAKDLEALFGTAGVEDSDKKKRSSDDNEKVPASHGDEKLHKIEKKSDHPGHREEHDEEHYDEHEREEEEHEREHEHDDDDDDDDDHDFDDNDDENDKKKKRAIKRSSPEVVKEDQIIPGDLIDFNRKKSIQWSKYFGMDRRKKSEDWLNNYNRKQKQMDHEMSHFRGRNDEERKKKDISEDKLENMDKKLKNIEDLIIDETVKYTGAHEGISNNGDIRKLKDHVISRLATAYSLEKMRKALEKLKQTVDDDRHLNKNEIESDNEDAVDKEKRVAIKKEKVDFDNNKHHIDSATEKVVPGEPNNDLDEEDEEKKKKKKKKRNGLGDGLGEDFEEELGAGHFEPMTESFMGARSWAAASNECPLLETMEKRCRGVDLLSGDIHQDLLPVCGVHQLCYLCGTSQSSCDFQYLSEADSICGHNTECQSAARSALMILRGSPSPQLGPRECSRNQCLYRAMREIGL